MYLFHWKCLVGSSLSLPRTTTHPVTVVSFLISLRSSSLTLSFPSSLHPSTLSDVAPPHPSYTSGPTPETYRSLYPSALGPPDQDLRDPFYSSALSPLPLLYSFRVVYGVLSFIGLLTLTFPRARWRSKTFTPLAQEFALLCLDASVWSVTLSKSRSRDLRVMSQET